MKMVLSWLSVIAFALAVSGCNTVQGIGKDVQKAGEAVQDAAKKK
jgi:predicted small secreted protein